jgi:2-dehydropantoate 2-reductase
MGAIIELGRMLELPTPHIDAVYACVKLLNETMATEHVGVKAYPLN